jgi:hypothetical protein
MRVQVRHALSELRAAARILVLLPFLLSALIPSGFMPEFGQSGLVRIVICTGTSLRTVVLDENGAVVPDPAGGPNDTSTKLSSICPFSALGASMLPVLRGFTSVGQRVFAVAWQGKPVSLPQRAIVPGIGARAPPLSI